MDYKYPEQIKRKGKDYTDNAVPSEALRLYMQNMAKTEFSWIIEPDVAIFLTSRVKSTPVKNEGIHALARGTLGISVPVLNCHASLYLECSLYYFGELKKLSNHVSSKKSFMRTNLILALSTGAAVITSTNPLTIEYGKRTEKYPDIKDLKELVNGKGDLDDFALCERRFRFHSGVITEDESTQFFRLSFVQRGGHQWLTSFRFKFGKHQNRPESHYSEADYKMKIKLANKYDGDLGL